MDSGDGTGQQKVVRSGQVLRQTSYSITGTLHPIP